VVVLRGSGRDMVPVPEMAAFGERFGFQFVAHAIGNANRSARVERPFRFIEGNFLAGRTFFSWEDLNQRAREWCDNVNSTYKKHIRAVPRELFAVERLHLKPLPAAIPEVCRLHQRLVDNAARGDLRGGYRATDIPTATRTDGDRISFRRLTNHAVAVFTTHSSQDRKTCPEHIGPLIVNGYGFRNIGTM
jgi:hypothetical protein